MCVVDVVLIVYIQLLEVRELFCESLMCIIHVHYVLEVCRKYESMGPH